VSLLDVVHSHYIIPFCPEQLGGLPTPRSPAFITGGDGADALAGPARLFTKAGEDVTHAFRRGAQEALKIARLTQASMAIMKDRSPSCGLRTPYCETPSGFGVGVTAALFKSKGIKIVELGTNDRFSSHMLPQRDVQR
jgi:uncharacterized protein YbbK (DUF523 family)